MSSTNDRNSDDETILLLCDSLKTKNHAVFKMDLNELLLALNVWFEIPNDLIEKLADAIQDLDSSLFLIYQMPNSLSKFGCGDINTMHYREIAAAINIAGYKFSLSLRKLEKLDNKSFYTVVQFLMNYHKACDLEFRWAANLYCPDKSQYFKQCIAKRGNIMAVILTIMKSLSTKNTGINVDVLSGLLGQLFQIAEDYKNFNSKDSIFYRHYFSGTIVVLPLVDAVSKKKSNSLLKILYKQTTDMKLQEYFINEIKEMGSLEYTKNVITDLQKQVKEELKKYENNQLLLKLIDKKI